MTVRAVFRRTVGAQWPILLVGSIFAVGFVLAGANFWRRGALLIGIGVGVAAVLRLVLRAQCRAPAMCMVSPAFSTAIVSGSHVIEVGSTVASISS
ncbi:DUF3017 domain-containing protein [Mycobacterium tuberculosis]|uniref:DUF3017 domain-containing protein n=1 Tax=Mycobacterium tuberculosis TaxID=1773 RepID=UPI0008AA0EA7|nr:DUF3017 domain-containing protein [Mycobacterium tuberculosis]